MGDAALNINKVSLKVKTLEQQFFKVTNFQVCDKWLKKTTLI